jgi:Mg-chelatase subunit ChlI
MLASVTVSEHLFDFISQLCCEFEVASLRADIVLHKAARALAALDAGTGQRRRHPHRRHAGAAAPPPPQAFRAKRAGSGQAG